MITRLSREVIEEIRHINVLPPLRFLSLLLDSILSSALAPSYHEQKKEKENNAQVPIILAGYVFVFVDPPRSREVSKAKFLPLVHIQCPCLRDLKDGEHLGGDGAPPR